MQISTGFWCLLIFVVFWKFHRLIRLSFLFLFFSWHQNVQFYVFLLVLSIASFISFFQPFGLLFTLKNISRDNPSISIVQQQLINKQKQEQQIAFDWLEDLGKNPSNFPQLFSSKTNQSRFYDYLRIESSKINLSSYVLLTNPQQILFDDHQQEIDEPIVISILYSQQDTDRHQGKFYVGQVLHHLLKYSTSRFLVTLCENNNSIVQRSESNELIRRLVPLFIVNAFSTVDMYEQEKQAHLQCILANFQSFPTANYLLLLQDDAKPIDEHFHSNLFSLIETRLKKQWPLKGQRTQPAFVKIYHPRWLTSYFHPSFYIVVQFIATSLLLSFIFFAVIRFLQQFFQFHFRFVLIYLLISLVLILLNHSNVSWTWRSLHPAFYAIYPAPSCCLPGVLYFRQTYSQVIDYLNEIQCRNGYAIDTAFDDLPKRTSLKTFLVEPNLVHHIGLYSRLRHAYINPFLLD